MALDQFKPQLWSRRFIVNVDKALVFKNVVDTTYEGEIQYGNVLKINEIGDITVSDYGSADISYQDIDDAQRELVIDQRKYFAYNIDDVDAAQSNVSVMDGAMRKAAHAVGNTIDTFIAGKYTEAGIKDATNLGTSPTSGLSLYASSMPGLLTHMMRKLKEANAIGQPWCVAPPWFMQLLRFAQITTTGNTSFDSPNAPGLTSDAVYGMGFNFYESNNVVVTSTYSNIMFGTSDAIAYAGQVSKIEGLRLEKRFADAMRGLYVYGAKVVRPDHLGVVHAKYQALTS